MKKISPFLFLISGFIYFPFENNNSDIQFNVEIKLPLPLTYISTWCYPDKFLILFSA